MLSARVMGKLTWLDALLFGVLMPTKGLVAVVAINVAFISGE